MIKRKKIYDKIAAELINSIEQGMTYLIYESNNYYCDHYVELRKVSGYIELIIDFGKIMEKHKISDPVLYKILAIIKFYLRNHFKILCMKNNRKIKKFRACLLK